MKTTCAWCGLLIRGNPDDKEVSHGMCESCFAFSCREIAVMHREDKAYSSPEYQAYLAGDLDPRD